DKKSIFPVEIDNTLTVDDLKYKIKSARKDLLHKNFELYRKDFNQENYVFVDIVNKDAVKERRGRLMEPSQKIFYYFSVEDVKRYEENPPYFEFDGEIGENPYENAFNVKVNKTEAV
ncbi:9934_t:CDS:2, partial [Funneliformis mosseae]